MTTANSKNSYVVMLENSKEPPKLVSKVKPLSQKDMYLISLIHPNTGAIVFEQEYKCKDYKEAFKKANELKELPEHRDINTWYEEKRYAPKPKRGKMKLKTKEDTDEENLALAAEKAPVKTVPTKLEKIKKVGATKNKAVKSKKKKK